MFFGFIPGSSQFNDFEVQCDNTLHFTETDQIQCYKVALFNDAVCEYRNEYFLVQIVLVEGSPAVDIDLEYGHTTVYIDDSQEPECGIIILYVCRYKFILVVYALHKYTSLKCLCLTLFALKSRNVFLTRFFIIMQLSR